MEKKFEKALRRTLIAKKVFTPATPISRKGLFAGRHVQITRALDVMSRPGQHGIVFGERGVGKTSLVSVLHYFFPTMTAAEAIKVFAARVNANADHTFDSLWREIFSSIPLIEEGKPAAGYRPEVNTVVTSYAELLGDNPVTPGIVQTLLTQAGARNTAVVVVIDEFDRVQDPDIRRLMADAIKNLSDHTVPATLFLVGVADTVEQLIGEHKSIQRALIQIPMPRMSAEDLKEILTSGLQTFSAACKDFELKMDEESKGLIAFFSRGMPNFTHLLGLHASIMAINAEDPNITKERVFECMDNAVQGVEHSIQEAYMTAVSSAHKNNLYRQVLTACALTPTDEMGFFSTGDVRSPLSAIMGKTVEIPQFLHHLDEFRDSRRGPILQRKGEPRNYRFRFIDPMMEAYVVMRGYEDQIVPVTSTNDEGN